MRTIFTIGYEGAIAEDFLATLKLVGVEVLVDVRDVPISRKPGFSKARLSILLADAGVRYLHMPALGDPKPGREAARAGDLPRFRKIFSKHLMSRDAQHALDELAQLATESAVCMLCFERDHSCCHRSIIADALVETGNFRIKNVGVRAGLSKMQEVERAAVVRSRNVR